MRTPDNRRRTSLDDELSALGRGRTTQARQEPRPASRPAPEPQVRDTPRQPTQQAPKQPAPERAPKQTRPEPASQPARPREQPVPKQATASAPTQKQAQNIPKYQAQNERIRRDVHPLNRHTARELFVPLPDVFEHSPLFMAGQSEHAPEHIDVLRDTSGLRIGDAYTSAPIKLTHTSVSNIPRGLISDIQRTLAHQFEGYTFYLNGRDGAQEVRITDTNRVFQTTRGLVYFLLFMSFRHTHDLLHDLGLGDVADTSSLGTAHTHDTFGHGLGLGVQYAKQWLVGHHPNVFQDTFDVQAIQQAQDMAFDVYAMVFAFSERMTQSHAQQTTQASHGTVDPVGAGLYEAQDTLIRQQVESREETRAGMSQLASLLERTHLEQMAVLRANYVESERQTMLQTVLVLERMGLLKGGIPSDTQALLDLLEQNRDVIRTTDEAVSRHVEHERERARRLRVNPR